MYVRHVHQDITKHQIQVVQHVLWVEQIAHYVHQLHHVLIAILITILNQVHVIHILLYQVALQLIIQVQHIVKVAVEVRAIAPGQVQVHHVLSPASILAIFVAPVLIHQDSVHTVILTIILNQEPVTINQTLLTAPLYLIHPLLVQVVHRAFLHIPVIVNSHALRLHSVLRMMRRAHVLSVTPAII